MTTEVEITPQTKRKSVWIIRLLGLFLLLAQAGGLIFGGAYYFKKKNGQSKSSQSQTQAKPDEQQNKNANAEINDIDKLLKSGAEIAKIATETEARRYKGIFNPIGILIALSAIGFFFRFRSGWLIALLLEGAILYVCLSLYFGNQLIPLIYPIMLYGIFMVLFLNSGAVRKAFLPRLVKENER